MAANIKAIEAVDPLTVKFTLCYPDAAFLSKVAFSVFSIHQAAQLQDTGGGGDALLSNPIGTGPYKLAKWDHGNEMDLVANENYRGPAPKVKNIVIKWNSEVGFTRQHTILSERQVGDIVNLEVDIIGKYVENLSIKQSAPITAEFLREHGFQVN